MWYAARLNNQNVQLSAGYQILPGASSTDRVKKSPQWVASIPPKVSQETHKYVAPK